MALKGLRRRGPGTHSARRTERLTHVQCGCTGWVFADLTGPSFPCNSVKNFSSLLRFPRRTQQGVCWCRRVVEDATGQHKSPRDWECVVSTECVAPPVRFRRSLGESFFPWNFPEPSLSSLRLPIQTQEGGCRH